MLRAYNVNTQTGERMHQRRQVTSRLRLKWIVAATAAIILSVPAFAVQATKAVSPRKSTTAGQAKKPAVSTRKPAEATDTGDQKSAQDKELEQYKPLFTAFAQLLAKLQENVQFPPSRSESRLLPLLPATTAVYAGSPNLGDAAHQAQQIIHQELQDNRVLREWWQKAQKDYKGPSPEDALEKVHQFFYYLGNEVVLSSSPKDKDETVLIVAEVKKPGLAAFLHKLIAEYGSKTSSSVQVFTPQELLAATSETTTTGPSAEHLLVLVRPDFVVGSGNLDALKRFSAQLDSGGSGSKLNTAPFGQRLLQSYHGGAGLLLAADLQQLISLRPQGSEKNEMVLQQTGFGDVKYLVAERKDVGGQPNNRTELSFNGPRHGVASWLAAPAPMGGLDFVSANATMVSALELKSPAEMLDDALAIADATNPGAGQGIAMMQAGLNIRLKEDLLSKLTGEIAVAVDGPIMPDPAWTVILKVSDAAGLQKTIDTLLAAMNAGAKDGTGMNLERHQEGGITYRSLQVPGGQKPVEISYAMVDGYMVVGPGREKVAQAIHVHQSGRSLAKVGNLQTLLPQDHPSGVSALLYQNIGPLASTMLGQISPELAKLNLAPGKSVPSLAWADGQTDSIRVGSNNGGFDIAVIGVVAAIAIPNLLRSRTAANEAAAASTMRTMSTAQVTYSIKYDKRGYAPDLATLGPGDNQDCDKGGPSENHACLIDAELGCSSGTWCTKSGYRYSITSTCKKGSSCDDYVVIGTPVTASNGTKSYCSTSDAVLRFKTGPPLETPISAEECQSWSAL